MYTLIASLRSFSLANQALGSRISAFKLPVSYFHSTPVLGAEPLKKRKRIDPTVLKERAEKKIRRIQRDIRRLEKVAKKYKPISELEVPRKVLRDAQRVRSGTILNEAELIERVQLKHQWAVYKRKQHVAEMYALQRIVNAQEKALDALQETSTELYEEALQPDPSLIPFKMKGPVETPPIENYLYPDGEFIDITKEYMPIIPTDPIKQRKLGLLKKK